MSEIKLTPLNADDLLRTIQSDARWGVLNSNSRRLPGRYTLDHRIHVTEGAHSDWLLCPIEKEPLFQLGKLPMPNGRERQKQLRQLDLLDPSTFSSDKVTVRYLIAHELLSRNHKEEIERTQHIPIELIEPISKWEQVRTQLGHSSRELVSWSMTHLVHLAKALRKMAPTAMLVLGGIVAAVVAITVIVALIQALLAILATVLVSLVLVAGLAAGGVLKLLEK